ncbi:MAG TPA: hypothetical protein VL123_02295 [Candidatus Udaeobacter sp.]|jgi:hypothetical protein|nr:hypothetical protein [Candidatus Udaeobacter sp.]
MADRKTPRRETRRTKAQPRAVAARPGFTLTARWAAVILAVIVALFFHDLLFGGKTFVSPDTTAPLGFVRMGEQSLWHDHVYPLWNPYVFLGMPSFASGAYNPLIYPPDWPLALLQKVVPLPDMTWLILYYALGAWFFFLLAREWGARAEGALLGAIAFAIGPNLVAVGSHGHGSQLVDSAYLPLMLWLSTLWLRRGRWEALGALALAGGFQMLRGHVQICFYTWLAIGLHALIETIAAARRPAGPGPIPVGPAAAAASAPVSGLARGVVPGLGRALALAAAAALAFGIAGVFNLPLHDYARWSIRGGTAGGGVGMTYATAWSLSPIELPTIVLPYWAGFGGPMYWGGMPFTDYPNAYVGMITVILALPAFLANGSLRVFALTLSLIALLIAFGHNTPLYAFLYAHLPLFNKFRVPVMIILLFEFAACLGTAWGWTTVLERRDVPAARRAVDRMMLAVFALLGVGLVVGVIGRDAWQAPYEHLATASHPQFSNQAASLAFAQLVGDIARVSVLGLAAALLIWLAVRSKLTITIATAIAAVLLLVELAPISGSLMQPVIGDPPPRNTMMGRDDVTDFLSQAGPAGSFRILPLDEYQSNRFAGFGIASVGGYHAAKPRLFQDFFEAHESQLLKNPYWMRLLNVRFIVSEQAIDQAPPYLREVHRGSAYVYENLLALPRATVVGEYHVVSPPLAILDSVAAGARDAARSTYLEQDPHLALGSVEGATVAITSYRLNDVTLEVRTPGPALVRLSDLWYPDWIARVDGREVPILKADYLVRAVPVAAGSHRIEFRFRSAAMRQGLTLSIASFLAALALMGFGLWRARRPSRAAPRGEAPAAPVAPVGESG